MTIKRVAGKFLLPGKQTKITPAIREVTSNIKGNGLESIQAIYEWVEDNIAYKKDKDVKSKVFRKRRADEILQDKYSTGCTDTALLFISLCRAKKIPTKYVEAVKKESDGSQGHVFAECFVDDTWIVVDPTNRWHKRSYDYKGFDVIARGLDSWDIGTGSLSEIKAKTKEFRSKQQ